MHEQDAPAPAAVSSEPGRLARLGPPVLIVAMLGLGGGLLFPFLADDPGAALAPRVPLLVLLAGFIAFEIVILHVPLGRDLDHAQEINVTEVVLVVGLFLSAPLDLVLASSGAVVVINLVRRTQAPLKQVFNASSRVLDAGIALTVFGALAPADLLSTGGWLAATAAGVAAGFASSAAVTLVVRCVAGPMPAREFTASALSSVPLSVMCAAVGYVGVVAVHTGGSATVPVLIAIGSLLLIMRTTTVLGERHLHLVELHQFGREVSAAPDLTSLLATTLGTAIDLVHAREVTAYVVPGAGSEVRVHRRGPDGTLTADVVDRSEVPAARGLADHRSTLVSTASLGDDGELVLAVSGRRSGMGLFRREDVRVLDLVTHRAGSDLRTLLLIERLRFEALHDTLTGLPNLRSVTDAARRHELSDGPVAAVWLGLRGMQEVNAALGHALGDQLLVQVGRRLAQACGSDALVGRAAGDEFAIVFLRPGSVSPAARAAAILSELAAPFLVADVPVLVQGQAGVAALPTGAAVPPEDVLRRADIAMRLANRTGRPVVSYAASMETSTTALLTLASELQAGIAEDQLVLHAQPQHRLADGTPFGVELLVRWKHPRLGTLTPDRFLPLAASTGLDRELTAWVVEASIAALAGWREQGLDLRVSINVVPAMITDGSILELLEKLFETYQQPADRVTIEVVESGLIDSPDRAAEVLTDVAALGTLVAIDDFGTGYSSLSHLRRLPVHEIKIDHSFVTTMLTDDDAAAIVTALVGMGHSLGLTVVAEGIETEAILDRLRSLGCDAGQGYHLAHPMPLDDVPGWVRAHASSGTRQGGVNGR